MNMFFQKIFNPKIKTQKIISVPDAKTSFNSETGWTILGISGKAGKKTFLEAYADSSWVYSCVSRKAADIASLPIKLYQMKGENKEEVKTHAILDSLNFVNNNMTRYDLIEWMIGSLELSGNFYVGIVDSDARGPKELLPYIPALITPIANSDSRNPILRYEYEVNGSKIPILTEKMLHIKYYNPGLDGYVLGLSPLSAAAIAYKTDKQSALWNFTKIKQGCSLDVVLTSDNSVFNDAAKRKEAIESWNQRYQGAYGEKTALLFGGIKMDKIGLSPKDMEYITQRKMSREEILAIYKVPPAVIGIYEYANYANAEIQEKFYWQNGLLPIIRKIESGLNEKYVTKFKDSKGMFLEFDLSSVTILKEALDNKLKNAKEFFAMGVPYNTIAEKLDLPIKEIPGGDIGFIPFSLTPVESAAEETIPAANAEPDKRAKLLKKLTDTQKEIKWKTFVKISDKFESRVKLLMKKYFTEQEADVISNLNKYKSMKKKINIEDILFDDDEIQKLLKNLKPLYLQIILKQATQEINNFNFDISFNLDSERVSTWIKTHGLNASKNINDTTKEALRKTLSDGIDAGESIPELSKRVGEVYNQARDYRTDTIARTETISASNEANLEVYRQSGVVNKKGWLSAMDERTRDTHIEAGREYNDAGAIKLNEDFFIGAGRGSAPGQIGLPEEDINCRCTIYPVIGED